MIEDENGFWENSGVVKADGQSNPDGRKLISSGKNSDKSAGHSGQFSAYQWCCVLKTPHEFMGNPDLVES